MKALDLEEQYYAQQFSNNNYELVIRFPDPEISDSIVKGFSSAIKTVSFPQRIEARECTISINETCNVEKVIREIKKVKFGTGRLSVRRKLTNDLKLGQTNPEEIDPFTIYFGNLPNTKIPKLKQILQSNDVNIKIGQNKRKPKSFAVAEFKTFEEAVRGFKKCTEKFPPSQFITIKFKRNKLNSTPIAPQDNPDNEQETPVFPIEQILTSPIENSIEDKSKSIERNSRKRSQQRKKKNSSSDSNGVKNSLNEIVESTDAVNNSIQQEVPNQQTELIKTSKKSSMVSLNNQQMVSDSLEYDPNKEIKIEPDTGKYLGFRKTVYDDDDMDGDTDCSNSTYRCSNSLGSERAERRLSQSSDESVLAITDTDDDESNPPTMKKPKLLVLPMVLHGSLREVKDEKKDASTDDDIGDIGDFDFL